MNHAQIIRYARVVMDDQGIIIPSRREMIHYIRFVIFVAEAENLELTGKQIANRLVEIARNDYIATSARCGGARIGAWNFGGGDAIDSVAVEDVL